LLLVLMSLLSESYSNSHLIRISIQIRAGSAFGFWPGPHSNFRWIRISIQILAGFQILAGSGSAFRFSLDPDQHSDSRWIRISTQILAGSGSALGFSLDPHSDSIRIRMRIVLAAILVRILILQKS
jgi:tRNA threonylcarbamoyladenosine modification (KEOPS) complex  Pcc1 subunit